VNKQSDIIPKYDERAWLSDEAEIRAPGTESSGSGWTVDNTLTYLCENYAHHKDNPIELLANEDNPYNSDRDATMFVIDKLLMRMDVLFAGKHMVTGAWTSEIDLSSSSVQWNLTTALPVADIETGKQDMEGLIARGPTKMILAREALGSFLQNADLLDRIKYTMTGQITEGILASISTVILILLGVGIGIYLVPPASNSPSSFGG